MSSDRSDPSRNNDRTEEFLRLLSVQEQRLLAMILAMVPDWSAAEDIRQEVRIRLWKEFDRYDPTKDFGAWCRTIAYYEVLTYRKKKKLQHPTFSEEFFETIVDEVAAMPDDQSERLGALKHCLDKLPELNRKILLNYYSSDGPMREIAQQMGRTVDSTRQRMLRSRRALAECIEQQLRQGISGDDRS